MERREKMREKRREGRKERERDGEEGMEEERKEGRGRGKEWENEYRTQQSKKSNRASDERIHIWIDILSRTTSRPKLWSFPVSVFMLPFLVGCIILSAWSEKARPTGMAGVVTVETKTLWTLTYRGYNTFWWNTQKVFCSLSLVPSGPACPGLSLTTSLTTWIVSVIDSICIPCSKPGTGHFCLFAEIPGPLLGCSTGSGSRTCLATF